MENRKKKKNVSLYKLQSINESSYSQGPNSTLISLTLKDPMKIGYLALFVDLA